MSLVNSVASSLGLGSLVPQNVRIILDRRFHIVGHAFSLCAMEG